MSILTIKKTNLVLVYDETVKTNLTEKNVLIVKYLLIFYH